MKSSTKRRGAKAFSDQKIVQYWNDWCKSMEFNLIDVLKEKDSNKRGVYASSALVESKYGEQKCISYNYSKTLGYMKEGKSYFNVPNWFKDHLETLGVKIPDSEKEVIKKSKGIAGLFERFVKAFKF